MHQSMLVFREFRYLRVALLLCVAVIAVYAWHDPLTGANGGSWYGYTLGTIGALLILWLAWFGIRKRRYGIGQMTLQEWLSAHVYLGVSLIIIATLHTGFQFGINIHTLAYALIVLVIVSGIFGVFTYRTYPSARNDLKKTRSLDELFLQVEELDAQLIRMVNTSAEDIRHIVTSAIARTMAGGSFFDQLLARDGSVVELGGVVQKNSSQEVALDYLLGRSRELKGEELNALNDIIRTFNSRRGLLEAIRDDIRMAAIIQVWLYVHVPATFALISALLAHVYAVFIYW